MRNLLLVLLVTACSTPTDPNALPDGAVWLDPVPTEYATYWRETETCSGLTGEFASVRWVVWPGMLVIPGSRDLGRAHVETRIIELAGRALAPVKRHEILHMLLGPAYSGQHPEEYFVTRCGDLVVHH